MFKPFFAYPYAYIHNKTPYDPQGCPYDSLLWMLIYLSVLSDDLGHNAQALSFVYPYGATLNVAKPATAILSTGS